MKNLLLLLTISFAFGCDIPAGNYVALTESEYSLKLTVREEGRVDFIHEAWLPGDMRHVRELHQYSGEITCNGNEITLQYLDSQNVILGRYEERSLTEEFFSIDESAYVLNFLSTDKGSLVYGWAYWPEQFLTETFSDL